jgi:hypothetical protein
MMTTFLRETEAFLFLSVDIFESKYLLNLWSEGHILKCVYTYQLYYF